MQWFKFYGGEYLSDAKILALTPAERSCWLTLLCYASISEESNGKVFYLSESMLMIQSGINYQDEEWNKTIGVLKKLENLNMVTNGDDFIVIKNWSKRQERALSGYERNKRYRERKKENQVNGDTVVTNGDENGDLRVEKRRIEKNREDKKEEREGIAPLTPREQSKKFFSMVEENGPELHEYISKMVAAGIPKDVAINEVKKFHGYWTELNSTGKKQRWQSEKTFEIKRRLATWFSKVGNYSKRSQGKYEVGKI